MGVLSIGSMGVCLVLLAGALPAAAGDALPAEEVSKLTAIIEKAMADERQPGLNVGIWIPGWGEWVHSFGTADIATGAAMDAADHVRIASITKTFTAVAVLRLVDQGKIRLDDKLAAYVEGIPNGDKITVRNLLGMTSGIYDFTEDEQFGKDFEADPLMPFGFKDLLAIVERHKPDFAPGAKVSYCDTNYALLGMIIEKIAGKPAGQLIEAEILKPLKLDGTSYPTTAALPEPFAHGYFTGDDGKGPFKDYTASNPEVASTAGAMISTLADLRIWAKALATGSLLTPATRAEQMKFGSLPVPGGLSVGYGLGIAKIGGLIGHNGAILGYTTAMFYVPDADATIVVEGNQSSNSSSTTTTIAYALAAYLFPGQIESPKK